MGDFGPRFINLFDDPRLPAVGVSSVDLGARLRLALALPDVARGPATLYLSRPARFSGELDVRSSVGWLFGPGAFIVLARGARLTIRGEVDLGIEPRFREEDNAEVRLLGPLDALRPEWWGSAVAADGAMRAAVRCAFARANARVAQVPIRLTGPYRLRETLRIGPRPHDEEVSLAFEGSHPRGDLELAPTFSRHPDAEPGAPLWRVEAGVALDVTAVAFDLRIGRASPRGIGAIENAGFTAALGYSRCTFVADRGVAVWVAARVDDGTRADWHRGVLDRATFSECWFEMEGAPDGGAIALKFADEGPLRARVDGCTFRGSANAMIAMPVGKLEVTGCQFHNTSSAEATSFFDGGAGQTRIWPGPDLLVGELAQDEVEARYPRPLAPLGVSVTHVQSTSHRFLYGRRTGGSPDSFVVATGVVSRPEGAPSPSVPSIHWRGPVGGGILLQGCDLRGACDVDFHGDEVLLAVASRLRAPVFSGAPIRRVDYETPA